MRNMTELNVLLRARVELNTSAKLEATEYRESWKFFTGDASKIEKKVRTGKWYFIKIPTGL